MEQIVKKLLTESGYITKIQGITYYSKEDKSFFFILSLSETQFKSLKNKDLIKKNQEYNTIMEGFKTIINSGGQNTIEKNSSLIVLVKCNDINTISNLQQQILLFEEDEYFFKKYVIVYTNDSIIDLTQTPLLPELWVRVNNNEKFNQFATQGYKQEIAEFLVIVQLFIKLPFLTVNRGTEGFTSLNQKIVDVLGNEQALYTSLLQNAESLSHINFAEPKDEARINDLLSSLPHD